MTDEDATAPTEDAEGKDPAPADIPDRKPAHYNVLARKYRPSTFRDMIGQDAMVRVLTNAIRSGRLAHAFMLTGVRGVGKTTTARVLARGLNCIGPDADTDFGPTIDPCGVCEHCVSITGDRHVDVREMDAASHTGVEDIRDLIENTRYYPVSARYKVYIIDEVHMLSKNAFNALLKTLEEPPEYVKFIFATTEIRKVPITVLSRCQRFDLRRVEVDLLASYFSDLAGRENASVDPAAMQLIARAADGSVRDGLSLLDQAISDTGEVISLAHVRDMLGLADHSQTFDIFEALMRGDTGTALDMLAARHTSGADPAQVIEDLLEITHWLTRIKVTPTVIDDVTISEIDRRRGKELTEGLAMTAITRSWQMLLKGLGEVRTAPSALQAAEMVLIRLACASTLPTPEEAIKMLDDGATGSAGSTTATDTATAPSGGGSGSGSNSGSDSSSGGGRASTVSRTAHPAATTATASNGTENGDTRAALSVVYDADRPDRPAPAAPAFGTVGTDGTARNMVPEPPPAGDTVNDIAGDEADNAADEASDDAADDGAVEPGTTPGRAVFLDLGDVARLAGERRQGRLEAFLMHNARVVKFEQGHLEINGGAFADEVTLRRLRRFLQQETGMDWTVVTSPEPGAATLVEVQAAADRAAIAGAMEHPLVRAVLQTFPGATVREIEHPAPPPAHGPVEAPEHEPRAPDDTPPDEQAGESSDGT